MKQDSRPDFVVIDDDSMNNTICSKIIKVTIPGAIVNTFTQTTEGLAYILANYSGDNGKNAILFLDINMPASSGWEALEKFIEFPETVKNRVKIYMLSSSVDPQDKEKADNNSLVSGYITKPISQAKLKALFPDYSNNV